MSLDPLASNWTIEQILESLHDLKRVDGGSDLLAVRVAGSHPTRTAYIYVYGEGLDTISYDLEDEKVENGEWDHAVTRGNTESLDELRHVVVSWLSGARG